MLIITTPFCFFCELVKNTLYFLCLRPQILTFNFEVDLEKLWFHRKILHDLTWGLTPTPWSLGHIDLLSMMQRSCFLALSHGFLLLVSFLYVYLCLSEGGSRGGEEAWIQSKYMIYLNNDVFTPYPVSYSLCWLKTSTGPPSSTASVLLWWANI